MWVLFAVVPSNGKQYYLLKDSSNNKAIIYNDLLLFNTSL